ncbi:MAG TPA: MBL fold metallo-hydrolase, partial [Candidatus Dormibacteraeota bacterium]|nr:MBL fold metallo-hydrolase [Candidatus Dormibacteraeota bacterium]
HLIEDLEIDAVLISHGHHDHLHLPSLRHLRGHPPIVVPKGLGRAMRDRAEDVTEIVAGDGITIGPLRVHAVPAVHDGRRGLFGPRADALGYRIVGESRVYFAGDTDLFPAMAQLAGTVDVALLPVWGWGPNLGRGHLDPQRAAEAAALIRPRIAVPIHWGTFYPFALSRMWPKPLADPPIRFARAMAERAPRTEVRILAPGESISFGPGDDSAARRQAH